MKEMLVKKIAFALVAVSALGLAACGGTETANTATTDAENVIDQANSDLANAQDAAANLLDQAAEATENAVDAAQNTVDTAAEAVENAAQ
jgi:hypothetical protein